MDLAPNVILRNILSSSVSWSELLNFFMDSNQGLVHLQVISGDENVQVKVTDDEKESDDIEVDEPIAKTEIEESDSKSDGDQFDGKTEVDESDEDKTDEDEVGDKTVPRRVTIPELYRDWNEETTSYEDDNIGHNKGVNVDDFAVSDDEDVNLLDLNLDDPNRWADMEGETNETFNFLYKNWSLRHNIPREPNATKAISEPLLVTQVKLPTPRNIFEPFDIKLSRKNRRLLTGGLPSRHPMSKWRRERV